MADKFIIEKQTSGNESNIVLSGSIDENANLDLVFKEQADTIVIDLKGIKSINSYGIREWINTIKALPSLRMILRIFRRH